MEVALCLLFTGSLLHLNQEIAVDNAYIHNLKKKLPPPFDGLSGEAIAGNVVISPANSPHVLGVVPDDYRLVQR